MGAAYPELVRGQSLITEVLEREETQFRRTLENGLKLLDDATGDLAEGAELDGETAFKLYDTYGFPYDLTEDALRNRGISVDKAGFSAAMERQKAAARAAWKGSGEAANDEVWFDIAERTGSTEFTGYGATTGEGEIVALVKDGKEVIQASKGDSVTLLTNQTPFYGESGGQTGDSGRIWTPEGLEIAVGQTAKPLGRLHAHASTIANGSVSVGDKVHLDVDAERRERIRANHSSTHLLHAALRRRLGDHVTQKGSLVTGERFRFDFSHPKPLSSEEIAAIEAEVNAKIRANQAVETRLMSPGDAVEAGALALFGEKYGDEVRVLSMGTERDDGLSYSVELCGGTHVSATGDIGLFVISSESAVSSGVRRIEALTGEAARMWLSSRDEALRAIAASLKTGPEDAAARVVSLAEERKRLEKELSEAKRALALAGGSSGSSDAGETGGGSETIGDTNFSGQVIHGLSPKELRPLLDDAKTKLGSGVAAICAVNDGKAAFAVAVTDDLTSSHDAVALVRAGVAALGGKGGGGRPDMAQGGGPNADAADEAIAAVREVLANG
jgi:alanyl-tRNA synthetase